MKIGNKEFDIENKAYIMGILNVTPDSFSDGGNYNNIDKALKQTEKLIKEGATIIDIGGESTRPNYTKISDVEEIERVVPIIEAIKRNFDTVISLDTYKYKVAEAGIKSGVDLINDIWGLKYPEDKEYKMADIVAKNDVAVCIMHNREKINYKDFKIDIMEDLKSSIDIAKKANIKDDKIILDPGVGFAKTLENNLYVVNHLEDFNRFGYPILLGTSRKSMIGLTLDLPVNQREEGTIATTVIGLMKGCKFFRVHDVEKNMRALYMTETILRS